MNRTGHDAEPQAEVPLDLADAMVPIATVRTEARIPGLVALLRDAGVPAIGLKGPITRGLRPVGSWKWARRRAKLARLVVAAAETTPGTLR